METFKNLTAKKFWGAVGAAAILTIVGAISGFGLFLVVALVWFYPWLLLVIGAFASIVVAVLYLDHKHPEWELTKLD